MSPGEHALRVELEGYETLTQSLERAALFPHGAGPGAGKAAGEPDRRGLRARGRRAVPGLHLAGRHAPGGGAPGELARFLLRLDGFRDEPLYLGPSSPATVSVVLAPAAADPLARQKRERNRFYTAFGLFALSLPLPIFSWALA